MLFKLHVLHNRNGRGVLVLHQLIETVLPADHRVLMAGVGRNALSGIQVQDADPYRDEQIRFIAVTELIVDVVENLRRRVSHQRPVLDQNLGNDHEQRRRYALSGYIRHDHGQMGIIHQEEVVEIAAHFLGRVHGGINLELSPFREGGENIRQHICLNLGGDIQLRADSLLLRGHLQKLPDVGIHILLHLPERLVENAHLILGLYLHLGENRAFHDGTLPFRLHQLGRRIGQLPDRCCQCPGGSFDHNRGDNACNHNHENHELTHKAGQIPHDVVHLDIHAHIAGRFSGGCPEGIVDAHEPAEFLIADQGTHCFSSYHLLCIVGKCPFIVGFVISKGNRALRRVGIHHIPDFLFLRLHDIQVHDAAVLLDFAQLLEGRFIGFVLLAG